jgi:hypothetical protein
MGQFIVKDAHRKVKRDIGKVFGDDFRKIITELILNSDDSYNRLEQNHKNKQKKPITLWLDRSKRTMRILDQAEGMSSEMMTTIFSEYGGDYAGGDKIKSVRGLFGQGASDVLFFSASNGFESYIVSIRNNEASRCNFVFDGNKGEAKRLNDDLEAVRKKTGIKENGTLVVFGLPDIIRVPKQKELKDKIESFYMLRYILSNPKRQVLFYDDELLHRLSSSRYLMNDRPILLKRKAIRLQFDDRDLKSSLTLYEKKPREPQQIIIRDENHVVFDETMFGLDQVHGASHIAGEYVIEGISELLRDKLNANEPEEILKDSRDGFDGRHRYTKHMNQKLQLVIQEIIEENNIRRESKSYSLNNNKQIFDAMREINRYFNALDPSNITGINPGEHPPAEGLRFARPVISISKGKLYALHLYINPNLISTKDSIQLSMPENSFITLETSLSLQYKSSDIKANDFVYKTIAIRGKKITTEPLLLTATCGSYHTSVVVNVVKEAIIYPKNGLEFIPKKRTVGRKKSTTFNLYFDTEYIVLGTPIEVSIQYESKLFHDTFVHSTDEKHLIASTIGMIPIQVETHDYIEKIRLHAHAGDINTEALCYVKDPKEKDDGSDGILSKMELVFDEKDWQSTVIPGKGILQINGQHIINRTIMGNMGNKDPKNPTFEQSQMKYLYELIALESAKLFVTQQLEKKNLLREQPDLLFKEIQSHKTQVYMDMIKTLL